MGRYFITGDTHGYFKHIVLSTHPLFTSEDVLIILGDSGFNYHVYESRKQDKSGQKRRYISDAYNQNAKKLFHDMFPGTVFCIHGNHEARPQTIEGYKPKIWNGGRVWGEEEYPRILFGEDGEVYTFKGEEYIVIGGAYSVDKYIRLSQQAHGNPGAMWFDDEQPNEKIKSKVERTLTQKNWHIHGILSHTCPLSMIPTELFLSGIDQSSVDQSTEEWLETIRKRLDYHIWYFGHFHGNKQKDSMKMLYHQIVPLE